MQINPGRGFIGDSAVTPHTPYASTRPVWGARVRCMRAVIVVVVVFCFYCVVSYRPSHPLRITSALVVVVFCFCSVQLRSYRRGTP